jgi:endoglucanase
MGPDSEVVDRKVDARTNTIEVTLRYDAFDFDWHLVVAPGGNGVTVAVFVDKPVPAALEGRAGLTSSSYRRATGSART